jgi:hypothetical protein
MLNIFLILLFALYVLGLNERPVIGILTVPSEIDNFSSK